MPLPITAVFDDLPDPLPGDREQAPPPDRCPDDPHLRGDRRRRHLGRHRRVRSDQGELLPSVPTARLWHARGSTPSGGLPRRTDSWMRQLCNGVQTCTGYAPHYLCEWVTGRSPLTRIAALLNQLI